MYSLHDITSTCVKLETSDSTFTRESRYGVPTPGISAVKVEKTDEPCHLQIHQVMSRNEVVLQNGVTMRQKASPFPVNNIQDVASSKIVSNIEISAAQIQNSFRELSPDHGNRGLSSKMDTKGQIHVNQGIAYDHAPSNLAGTQGLSPTERITTPEEIAPMTVRKEEPKDSTILYDQRRDSTRVLSHQICAQMSGYQITSPDGIPCYKVCTTENTPAFFQGAQGEMPIHQIDPLAAMSGYKKDTQETRQKGYGEGPSSHQGISHQVDSQGRISGHQIAATQSVSFKQLQKQEELSAGQIDAHSTTSGYQISNQGEILNHQSGSQHGMSPYKADIHSSKSGYQTEGWNGMSTLPIVSQNGLSPQWSSYNGMSPRQVGEMSGYVLSGQGPTFTDSVEKQDKKPFLQMGYQNGMLSQDMDLQNGMSTHQVAAQHEMSCYQVDVHDVNTTHPMGYQDGRSVAQIDVHGRPPPPYQMGTDEILPGYPRLSHETRLPPNPITDYDNIRAYHTGFQENVKHQRMQFHQMDSLEMNAMPHSNTPHTCHCSCHLSSQPHSSHFPAFGLENQRPSVIMVPVAKSNIEVPVTSQIHSKGYIDDSDSSDESDNERKEKYFRRNIDGTTAKFKLTKEDWRRIPINSFPSGGRLLSGDWTRIFVSKVKESNPWCSLRFKNNHVRSENSRKIHSAVFFRGGAECKRPECNVKVRFVIRKEKGKYVEVTYVGNVCHRGQPSGSDFVNDRGRSKRIRRPRSFPD